MQSRTPVPADSQLSKDLCDPTFEPQWCIDYHEAGHAIVEYVLHDRSFHAGATLVIQRTHCPGKPGGGFHEGKRREVDVGMFAESGDLQLDEVWGYLGGPCAEWIERKNQGGTKSVEDWLSSFWASNQKLRNLQDDLSEAAIHICGSCPSPPALPQNCQSWTELHVKSEVLAQAQPVVALLFQWWDGVKAIVAAINSKRSQSTSEFTQLDAVDLGAAMIGLEISSTEAIQRIRGELEALNECYRDGRMACQRDDPE
jgi:hypothetical protein